MKNNMALKVAGGVFLLVSMAHLLRLIFKAEIIISGFTVPLWYSAFGFVFALLLSLWLFKSQQLT